MDLRGAALLALLTAAAHAEPGQSLPAPDEVLSRVAAALRTSDADALAGLAPPGARVLVDLAAPQPVRGTFTPGQLAAVLAHLFEQASTTSFELDPAARRLDGATFFARGRWRWRGEREADVTLVVILEWRASSWRLVELRSAP